MKLVKVVILINTALFHSRIYLEAKSLSKISNYLLNSIYKLILKVSLEGSYIKKARKIPLYKRKRLCCAKTWLYDK